MPVLGGGGTAPEPGWYGLAPLLEPLQENAVVRLGDEVVVVGGFDDVGTVLITSSGDLEGNIRGQVANLRLTSSSALINADGYGHLPGEGLGAGADSATYGGGGGSHGGSGTNGHANPDRDDGSTPPPGSRSRS